MADATAPDWKARLKTLLKDFAESITLPLRADSEKFSAIGRLTAAGTAEQLEAAWNTLTAAQKADTDLLKIYQEKKKTKLPATDEMVSQVTALLGGTADAVTAMFFPQKAYTVEESFDEARKFVALDFGKDIAVGLASLAVESASFGQIDNFQHFFSNVRTRTGYGGISSMVLKHPLELGLLSPLSKYLHSQYRDEYLSGQVALMLATKGHITDDQMRKAYQYEGYPDWMIDAFVKDRWRELRLGEIAWALNDALIDEKWLDTKLQNALYAPEDRPIIIRMIQEKYLRSYRDRVATQLRNLYKEGYMTYAEFSDGLRQLGIPDKVRNMLASEAQYLYRLDRNADLITTWKTAYKNDLINEDTLRGNLASIIKDPLRVEDHVQSVKAQRKPASVAVPKPETQGVRITSKPSNAAIYLDDGDTGKLTPETLTMSAGKHTIHVSLEGYDDAGYEVDIQAGQYVELYARLVPAAPA